jgi:hypothetical protein
MTQYEYLAFIQGEDQPFAGDDSLKRLKKEIKNLRRGFDLPPNVIVYIYRRTNEEGINTPVA